MQITIDPEFQSLIPPLRPEELRGLEESIQAEGCRDPLVVWGEENILIDGHNRLSICQARQAPYKITHLNFASRERVKLWILTNQVSRRNLTEDQRGVLWKRIKDQRSEIEVRERAKKGGEAGGVSRPKISLSVKTTDKLIPESKPSPQAPKPKTDTRAAVAKEAKLPENKLRDLDSIEKVIERTQGKAAARQTLDSILQGTKTVREAKVEARRADRETKKQAELEMRAAVVEESKGERLWEIRQGDCIEHLQAIEEGSVRLIFADPPYNIGINYGDHYDDSRPADEFDEWCTEWLAAAFRALTSDGSLWLLVNHEWARTLCFRAEDLGFHLRQWLTWYESFGVNTTGMFNRCSRPILWLVKDAGRFVFNDEVDEIRRKSDREVKYSDKRAIEASGDGKVWDDVWGVNPPIPRVVGTSKERVPGFPTQLPIALLKPIVACASRPGDLVIDPFNGSGTTGAACIELGRRYVGIELSERFADLARTRLLAHEQDHSNAAR